MMGCEPSLTNPLQASKNDAKKLTTCEHKHSSNRNFTYQGQLKVYQQEMYGQTVFVHEFTLVNGEKLYLSRDELVNYDCNN